jgi:hypothetical protein
MLERTNAPILRCDTIHILIRLVIVLMTLNSVSLQVKSLIPQPITPQLAAFLHP